MSNPVPPLSQLLAQFGCVGEPEVTTIQGAIGEARRLLGYVRELGWPVSQPAELLIAVNSLEGEEELAAFRCEEGVAISHASDGRWIVFVEAPGFSSSAVELSRAARAL